ncbi:MAG: STAS domain-containing protein [Planctomycetota bacterium]|nr:STAS domain-containing protein [Planctomycetota bacterium]
MSIQVEVIDGVTVLVPIGDLDITTMPTFEKRVDTLLAAGARDLVWDLAAIGILPSTAAGFLLQTAKRVRAADGRMVLCGCTPRTLGTLRMMGVLELFRVFPARAAALAALRP